MSLHLSVNDFKNKKKAYLLYKNLHGSDLSLTEVSIIRVGRKYVTVADGRWELKFQEIGKPYLIMEDDWRKSRLFLTKRDAEEYWERETLQAKIYQIYQKNIYSLPLPQLRLVCAILEAEGKEDMPEISGTMTVSTAHICQDTALFLDQESENPEECRMACRKDESGWTIHLPELSLQDEGTVDGPAIPEDLQHLFRLALHSSCNELRLDGDGPVVKGLPVYPIGMPEQKN